jgi:hypothetical protein
MQLKKYGQSQKQKRTQMVPKTTRRKQNNHKISMPTTSK